MRIMVVECGNPCLVPALGSCGRGGTVKGLLYLMEYFGVGDILLGLPFL